MLILCILSKVALICACITSVRVLSDESGKEVKARDAKGNLTARGKEFHKRPEVTIEIQAKQVGRNSTGEQYSISTTEVWAEQDHPKIGDIFAVLEAQKSSVRLASKSMWLKK